VVSPDAAPAPALEVLTAADAETGQRRVAGALAAAGLEPGDRVAFSLPSSAALLCAVGGALRTGVIPVLLNATLLPGERDALLADARPALTVTDEAELAALGEGPPVDLADHLLGRPMHYTSGTSGRPKGVWCGVWDEGTARRAADDEADLWGFGPDDVHLVCSPMYHSVSTRFALGTLLRGGTCVILGRFDAELALGALTGAAGPVPTTTFVAPAALQRLLALGDALPDRFDSLRLLVHAGSPCPPPVKRQAMDRVADGVVWEFLGSTEGQFTACPAEEWVRRPGTVGRARPGRRLEVDEAGVVWCHAPDFAAFAYWDDPVKTAAAWRGDAFTVGDLGHLDADGFLYLEGRRDDLIISGGVNVYPAEIEAALSEVPGVAQVAVFGVDDETWGQRVCAAVVADPGAGEEDVLRRALREGATDRLAGYKRPKEYFVVDTLPTTATGKVQRRKLPERLGLDG
jgi:acyl-CoA synthetase (AMP-forming)/AMP-acid ligase II